MKVPAVWQTLRAVVPRMPASLVPPCPCPWAVVSTIAGWVKEGVDFHFPPPYGAGCPSLLGFERGPDSLVDLPHPEQAVLLDLSRGCPGILLGCPHLPAKSFTDGVMDALAD